MTYEELPGVDEYATELQVQWEHSKLFREAEESDNGSAAGDDN